jgi:hypothetical protein
MSESIEAVIPLVRKPKSFGRSDTFTLVVTADSDRYWNMAPDESLHENPHNFAIQNSSVKKVRISAKDDSRGQDQVGRSYTELKIEASVGKFEFKVDGHDSGQIKESLKGVFGDIVK